MYTKQIFLSFLFLPCFSLQSMNPNQHTSAGKQEADTDTIASCDNAAVLRSQLLEQLHKASALMQSSQWDNQTFDALKDQLTTIIGQSTALKKLGLWPEATNEELKAIAREQANIAISIAMLSSHLKQLDSASRNEPSLSIDDFTCIEHSDDAQDQVLALDHIHSSAHTIPFLVDNMHVKTKILWDNAINPALKTARDVIFLCLMGIDFIVTGGGISMSYACSDM